MKNLAKLVMILTVCIVIIGGTLAPYVDGVTAETLTYTNEGMPYAAVDDSEHIIVLTSSAVTVDDEELDLSLLPANMRYYSIVIGEDSFIRMDTTSLAIRICLLSGFTTLSYSDETVTITINGDSAVVSTTASDTTIDVEDVQHYISSSGDYVLGLNPYVNDESPIIGAGHTGFTDLGLTVYTVWSGTMGSATGLIVTYVPYSSFSSVSVSDVNVNVTDVGSGLYQIDSVVVDYSVVDTSSVESSVSSTYTYFLAPAEVVYDNPDYLGASNAALVAVMVLLIIAALLVVTVRYVSREY